MGLNPSPSPHHDDRDDAAEGTNATLLDDLAAFALDAVDLEEAVTIEARLATDPDAARIERGFRETAGALAAGVQPDDGPEVRAAVQAMRARVIGAAHAQRPPVAIDPATAIEVHRIEGERLLMLLHRLRDEQWSLPLDPPEFAGWTIKDLVAHLASNEGNAAQVLGLSHPVLPETTNDNEARTAEVLVRHRSMTDAETLAELEACFRAVDEKVTELGVEGIEEDIQWWGMDIRIMTMLIVRSFETWTHADDIRRAVGLPQLPPPATSIARMSQVAASWAPLMMLNRGHDLSGTAIELHLTGVGGGAHFVNLGFEELDPGTHAPAAVVTIDVLDYCRVIGDRLDPADVSYEATGDLDLARRYVGTLDALATL